MLGETELRGIDGSNPLAFLAALGTLRLAHEFYPNAQLFWRRTNAAWRAVLLCEAWDEEVLSECICTKLKASGASIPYTIEKKMPFSAEDFRNALKGFALACGPRDRIVVDVASGLGTEILRDDNGNFHDTAFRMVRSGDSAGQGMPVYALSIFERTDKDAIKRALFAQWIYEDDGFGLRWDPAEDQRHALRWYDPSRQSNKKHNIRTVRGANALALIGLSLLPVQPTLQRSKTTGITPLSRNADYFSWPLWEHPATLDLVRSLVALCELQQPAPNRNLLKRRGVAEVYRAQRIALNQYYKNFTPALPV